MVFLSKMKPYDKLFHFRKPAKQLLIEKIDLVNSTDQLPDGIDSSLIYLKEVYLIDSEFNSDSAEKLR